MSCGRESPALNGQIAAYSRWVAPSGKKCGVSAALRLRLPRWVFAFGRSAALL
jgi:hypothetical protein